MHARKARVLQNGLFIPLAPEPEKLELMLARLARLVGPDNLGSPELLDTHRPDAFRVKRFVLKGKVAQNNRAHGDRKIRNPQSDIRNSFGLSSFFGHRCGRLCRPIEVSHANQCLGPSRSVYGKSYVWLGPGERLVIGGAWIDGPETSGTWQLNRVQKRADTQVSPASSLSHLSRSA